MESAERLKAENDRLMAEMASMKKKIKLALKKQQADLQAKIQAAEQRAAAAEEALAGSANGSPLKVNSQIAAPQSPGSALNGDSSPGLSLGSEGVFPVHGEMPASPEINNGEISHPLSEISPDRGGAQIVVDSLRAELKSEIEAGRSRDYAAAKERQLLESEITECNYLCVCVRTCLYNASTLPMLYTLPLFCLVMSDIWRNAEMRKNYSMSKAGFTAELLRSIAALVFISVVPGEIILSVILPRYLDERCCFNNMAKV